jgi:uncharacterized membrane protein
MTPFDIRTAVEVGTTVATAVAVVVTIKVDIRWLKDILSQHMRKDDETFENIRSELSGMRRMPQFDRRRS